MLLGPCLNGHDDDDDDDEGAKPGGAPDDALLPKTKLNPFVGLVGFFFLPKFLTNSLNAAIVSFSLLLFPSSPIPLEDAVPVAAAAAAGFPETVVVLPCYAMSRPSCFQGHIAVR